MKTLIWSKTFARAFKRIIKKHPDQSNVIENALRLLAEDPFVPQLETHKLKGRLSGSWACRAGYDLRIIFDFVPNKDQKEEGIFLMEIGTHDEVY
ncbi:MAG TPA: type II toxin-antitoxin system mRNA interferase toxin, RelE/StbE family [Spirochaetes bacterium]|nr:type II toxin-antitoxin system mRNA interferase toxin, RelE/StbE family [Spirochaetota bacterium]